MPECFNRASRRSDNSGPPTKTFGGDKITSKNYRISARSLKCIIPIILIFVFSILFNNPLSRAMELGITTELSQEFDDNVTASQNNEISDFLTNITLGLNAFFEGKSRTLAAKANITQQFFYAHDEFTNTAEDLSVILNQELGKNSRLMVTDILEHSEQPNTFEDVFGRQSGRYGLVRNRLNLVHTSSLSKQLQLLLKYKNETNQYDRKDILDSFVNGAGFETDYTFDSATTGVFRYDFSIRQFQNGPDAITHTISPGFKRSLTKQVLLEAYSGADFIHAYDNRDFIRPLYGVTLSDEVNDKTTVGVNFLKQYQANGFNSSELFNQWRFSGFLRKELSSRLSFDLTSFYGEGEYSISKITDQLAGTSVSVQYQVSRRVQTTASYSFSQTTSDDETRDYIKNVIFLGVKIDF